jgi:hypothetical protein
MFILNLCILIWWMYQDWEMLRFLQSLKSLLRVSNAVALITFPATLLKPSMAIRWQHLADILISVEAVLGKFIIRFLRMRWQLICFVWKFGVKAPFDNYLRHHSAQRKWCGNSHQTWNGLVKSRLGFRFWTYHALSPYMWTHFFPWSPPDLECTHGGLCWQHKASCLL